MTRRDYLKLSSALKEAIDRYNPVIHPNKRRGAEEAAQSIATAIGEGNPKFNQERFLKDCGVSR